MIQQCRSRLEALQSPAESADYKAWRNRFVQGRLRLCLWLAFVCLLTFVIRDLYDMVFPLREMADLPRNLKALFLIIDGVMAGLLFLCLLVQQTHWGRRRPAVVFFGLSWSITLIPQVLATLEGIPLPDILSWSLVFLTQAALIPMLWKLHLISQAGTLAYYFGVYPILGITTIHGEPIYNTSICLYLFWFCLVCDLSVYLYERLQRAEFESRRELGAFLHTVTHDLRTPVMGSAMVLQNLLNSPDDRITVNRHVLERMLQGSDRQMNLLNSLLEAHACDHQGVLLQPEPIHLDKLVVAALADLESQLAKNQVTITNDVSTSLPPVYADAKQLQRVFGNLISNALKHNPPGICLSLEAVVEANLIRCSVQDNGIGMNAQQCRHLFDLYTRGRRARYLPGLGLGLHLCKKIITAHGGQIGVNSHPGMGTTVWFTVPLASSRETRFSSM